MELYFEPLTILARISKEATPEMSEWQSAYLCGLIREYSPRKILEVGVAAGGTTALILNTLSMINCKAEVWSVDILEDYYAKPWLKTGFMAEDAKNIIRTDNIKHTLKIGLVPEVIDDIGDGIDFLILDTVHMVPGELLDFPICLPYLKEDAIVVLHDVILHATSVYTNNYATQLLLNCVTAEKKPVFGYDNEIGYPNIAAFMVNQDTRKYIYDVFSAMLLPWQYSVPETELIIYKEKYTQLGYSEECLEVFEKAQIANKRIERQKRENKINRSKIIAKTYKSIAGKDVFIYGAGEVGHYIYELFSDVINFKGYVVSDGQPRTEGALFFSEAQNIISDGDLIFVAMSPDKMNQIRSIITESQVKNVEYIDQNLFSLIYDYS